MICKNWYYFLIEKSSFCRTQPTGLVARSMNYVWFDVYYIKYRRCQSREDRQGLVDFRMAKRERERERNAQQSGERIICVFIGALVLPGAAKELKFNRVIVYDIYEHVWYNGSRPRFSSFHGRTRWVARHRLVQLCRVIVFAKKEFGSCNSRWLPQMSESTVERERAMIWTKYIFWTIFNTIMTAIADVIVLNMSNSCHYCVKYGSKFYYEISNYF